MPEKKNLFAIVDYLPISVIDLEKCIHAPHFWGKFVPAKEATADFTSETNMHFVASDNVPVPVTVEGDIEFVEEGDGLLNFRLVRENFHQVTSLFGRIRYREETPNKTKVGIFVEELTFSSGFLNLLGKTAAIVEAKTRFKKAFQKFVDGIDRGEVPPAD
ncbi:MAG TPA: hypothetical protein VKK79_15400 [Candidatus Lokiarchaeia archaeon]|nr:hypothetical protein [Candidatus Lokiarchaeia archaeon]